MKKVSLVIITEDDWEATLISTLMKKSEIGLNGLLPFKLGEIEDLTDLEKQEIFSGQHGEVAQFLVSREGF